MVIDASALVAILLIEPEAESFVAAVERAASISVSPTSVFETVAAIVRVRICSVSDARVLVNDLLDEASIKIVAITPEIGEVAVTAFDRFGKGRHPAQLNMGDCYTYALAKVLRKPLLFKDDDFGRTDIDHAV
jgi:ribonuclease VapC